MHDLILERTLQIANLFLIYTKRLSYRNRITVTFNPQWVWATLLRQGATRRGGNPSVLSSSSLPPYRRNCNKLNSAFGVTRESGMYVGSRKLARHGGGRVGAIYDWRRTCDRASWKFISARTAPSDKTYYHRPSDRAGGSCPCFRRTLLLPTYLRPSCPFFFRFRFPAETRSKVAIDSQAGRVSPTSFASTSIDSSLC